MYMRKTPVRTIKRCLARLDKAGLEVPVDQLEAQSLTGCDPELAVEAMIVLHEHGIDAPWNSLSVMQLAGRDLVECVDLCIETQAANYDSGVDGDDPPQHAICEDGATVAIRISYRFTMRLNCIIGFSVSAANEKLADEVRDAARFCPDVNALLERRDRLCREFESRLSNYFRSTENFALEFQYMASMPLGTA